MVQAWPRSSVSPMTRTPALSSLVRHWKRTRLAEPLTRTTICPGLVATTRSMVSYKANSMVAAAALSGLGASRALAIQSSALATVVRTTLSRLVFAATWPNGSNSLKSTDPARSVD